MNPQNNSQLIGRISSTIRFSTASNGASVAFFDLAVPKISISGQKKTEFFPVVCWRKVADKVKKECIKGQLVALTCSLSPLVKIMDKKRVTMVSIELQEISFLETKAAVLNRNKLKAQAKQSYTQKNGYEKNSIPASKSPEHHPVEQEPMDGEPIEIVSRTEVNGFLHEYGVEETW